MFNLTGWDREVTIRLYWKHLINVFQLINKIWFLSEKKLRLKKTKKRKSKHTKKVYYLFTAILAQYLILVDERSNSPASALLTRVFQ